MIWTGCLRFQVFAWYVPVLLWLGFLFAKLKSRNNSKKVEEYIVAVEKHQMKVVEAFTELTRKNEALREQLRQLNAAFDEESPASV